MGHLLGVQGVAGLADQREEAKAIFSVYFLKSLKDMDYYVGHSEDVEKRVKSHNSGNVKSTKGRRPLKLIYTEEYETRSEAFKRELFFKSPKGFLEKKRIIMEFDR